MANQKRSPQKGAAKKAVGVPEVKREAAEVKGEPPSSEVRRADKPLPTLTLGEAYESAYYYTGKTSEINRQLGLAGLAIIWVFKATDKGGRQIVPYDLFLPGLLLIIGLALDLLHYVVMGELWERYAKRKDDRGEQEFRVPKWLNRPGDVFYYLKIVAVVVAYILLIRYLWSQLFVIPSDLIPPPEMPDIK